MYNLYRILDWKPLYMILKIIIALQRILDEIVVLKLTGKKFTYM